jgi:transposase
MKSIGIDLGSRKSQICIADRGKVKEELAIATGDVGTWLSRQPPTRVLLESCAEGIAVAEQAEQSGHDVFIVPSSIVRQVGIGARRQKNDVRDARALANYGCAIEEPVSIHRKSLQARELLDLLGSRKLLLEIRGDLVRRVKGKMRERLLPPLPRARTTFTKSARELFVNHELGLGAGLEMLLEQIDSLDERINALTDQLEQLCEQCETARLLKSVPGVGALVALCFMATVDDPERFRSAEKLANYLGLTPGESTTGFKQNLTGITKAGPSMLRALLVQAAWSMYRSRPGDPAVQWAQRLANRRGNKSVAIIALARKLSGILLEIWKSQRPFDPSRAAEKAA